MFVRVLLLLWIVSASAAMFVGSTAVTMVVNRHDLTTDVADAKMVLPTSAYFGLELEWLV
jgi:hypothetical protein